MQQTDELVEQVASAIHGHLSRRNIMQYLDNPEDCEGIARVCIQAVGLRELGRALVEKIDAMIEDTNPIFAEMELSRGRPYTGAQIGDELEAFRTALTGAPANSSGEQGVLREALEALTAHAVHREYDYPGDSPVDCGLWCNLCEQHVEDDHSDHKPTCPIARLAALSPTTDAALAIPEPVGDGVRADPANLSPVHIRLLERGARYKWIGLADNAGVHVGEVVALGELERGGLVQPMQDQLPPGPPAPLPREITDAGRAALAALSPTQPEVKL